jgi:LacI family transcriptional regulator
VATIKEIASQTGLSPATVSRVLNYDDTISVSDSARVLIFDTAEKLGYQKKRVHPPIGNIALLYWNDGTEELEYAYYKSLRAELERQARERKISLTRIDKSQGVSAMPEPCNGFIAIGWFSKSELDVLKGRTKNGVFVDYSPDESAYDSVKPNLDSIVKQMVDFFYQKGHKNIGYIGQCDFDMATGKPSLDVREWSFRNTAAYYGILREENILIAEALTVERGYRIGLEAIERFGENLPSAFCVGSDTLAVGVIQALHEKKLEIPERVALLSINNSSVAGYLSPPLSTFHIDVPEMCRTAIQLLTERVFENREITKTVYINGRLIERKSC